MRHAELAISLSTQIAHLHSSAVYTHSLTHIENAHPHTRPTESEKTDRRECHPPTRPSQNRHTTRSDRLVSASLASEWTAFRTVNHFRDNAIRTIDFANTMNLPHTHAKWCRVNISFASQKPDATTSAAVCQKIVFMCVCVFVCVTICAEPKNTHKHRNGVRACRHCANPFAGRIGAWITNQHTHICRNDHHTRRGWRKIRIKPFAHTHSNNRTGRILYLYDVDKSGGEKNENTYQPYMAINGRAEINHTIARTNLFRASRWQTLSTMRHGSLVGILQCPFCHRLRPAAESLALRKTASTWPWFSRWRILSDASESNACVSAHSRHLRTMTTTPTTATTCLRTSPRDDP